MIRVTALLQKAESQDTFSLVKKPGSINPSEIVCMFEVEQSKDIPIIGEDNSMTFTMVQFTKDPPMKVMETIDEINALIAKDKYEGTTVTQETFPQ
jgi:hypothetical protein